MTTEPFTFVRIDASELAAFSDVRQTFWNAMNREEMPRAFREAARIVADEAKQEVSKSSTRLPSTIRHGAWNVAFGNKTKGFVKAGGGRGPGLAGLFEYGSKNSGGRYIRHPLFGNTNYWFNTPTKPFLYPAAISRQEAIAQEIEDGIERARRKAGL